MIIYFLSIKWNHLLEMLDDIFTESDLLSPISFSDESGIGKVVPVGHLQWRDEQFLRGEVYLRNVSDLLSLGGHQHIIYIFVAALLLVELHN